MAQMETALLPSRRSTAFGILSGMVNSCHDAWVFLMDFLYRSKLAAGVLGGLDQIFMKPGSKILYLGAGTEPSSAPSLFQF